MIIVDLEPAVAFFRKGGPFQVFGFLICIDAQWDRGERSGGGTCISVCFSGQPIPTLTYKNTIWNKGLIRPKRKGN